MIPRRSRCAFAAVALIATTLAIAPGRAGASAAPRGAAPRGLGPEPRSDTPLLTDFVKYCLRTRADITDAVKVARRDGMAIQSWPRNPAATYRPRAMWLHSEGERSVSTWYALMGWTKTSKVESPMCVSEDADDKGASLKGLTDWIGPLRRNHTMTAYEFKLEADGPHLISHDNTAALRAARASGDFFVLVAVTHGSVTSLTLRRWRGPA